MISLFIIHYSLFTPVVYAQDTRCDLNTLSSHEQALCNLNQGLLPSEIAAVKPVEKNLFEKFLDSLGSLFGFAIKHFEVFSPRAEVQSKSDLPTINCGDEASKEADLVQQAAEDLGKRDCPGDYNADLPSEVQKETKDVKGIEQLEAKSLFPEGINPFGDK